MKLTELKIAPTRSWDRPGDKNPLICTVKLSSETATVETALHPDQVQQLLLLVQKIVAEAAQRNVAAFVQQVTAIEATKEIEA
jgi:hypothetical protein